MRDFRPRLEGSRGGGDSEQPTDVELLRRMRLGDEAALEVLYDRYAGLVFTLALRIVGDAGVAREVLQDTFLRSWNEGDTYDAARGRVAWWLMGIARNRAIDLLRSRPHQARLRECERLPGTIRVDESTSTDRARLIGLRHAVASALEGLPTRQRQAIELAYYGGLTQTEIAAMLGEPLGTVKSRTREAMERLRVLLGPFIEPQRDTEQRRD